MRAIQCWIGEHLLAVLWVVSSPRPQRRSREGRSTGSVYFLSTVEDHIAPWKSTYAGTRLVSGPVRFVLGGSGHIAGVINPPTANKYHYWTNAELAAAPDEWLAGAQQHEGSWWSDWAQWIAHHAGKPVLTRQPGSSRLSPIEDAPGAYVKTRVG